MSPRAWSARGRRRRPGSGGVGARAHVAGGGLDHGACRRRSGGPCAGLAARGVVDAPRPCPCRSASRRHASTAGSGCAAASRTAGAARCSTRAAGGWRTAGPSTGPGRSRCAGAVRSGRCRARGASSSMADSMAKDAVAKPGPRIQIGVFTSSGTVRYAWRTFGRAVEHLAPGIMAVLGKRLVREVSACDLVDDRGDRGRAGRCRGQPVRLAGRKPVPKYICLRVSTSLTGRPISRAASAASSVRPARSPLPKAPPTNGEMTRTESAGTPNTAAYASLRAAHPLGLVPHGEPVAVPAGDGGVQLHRVVVVAGHAVRQVSRRRRPRSAASASPRA